MESQQLGDKNQSQLPQPSQQPEILKNEHAKEKPIIPKNKVVIVGDVYVGKTSISVRFVQDDFSEALDSTVGAVFLPYQVELDDVILQLDIWDTDTFKAAKGWLKQLNDNVSPQTILALVGNKNDLAEKRQVSRNEAEKYANENCLLYFEASAKTGDGVTDLFYEICKKLAVIAQNNPEHITIGNQKQDKKEEEQQGKCC